MTRIAIMTGVGASRRRGNPEGAALKAIKELGSGVGALYWTGDGGAVYGHEDAGNATAGVQWDEWSDLSAAGTNDATQADDAKQPTRTALGGGFVLTYASGNNLVLPAALFSEKAAVTFAFAGASDTAGTRWALDCDGTDFAFRLTATNALFRVGAGYGLATTNQTALHRWVARFDGAGADNEARCRLWKDGIEQELAYTGTVPSAVPAITTAASLGYNATAPYVGSVALFGVWGEALAPAAIVTIDSQIQTLLKRLS